MASRGYLRKRHLTVRLVDGILSVGKHFAGLIVSFAGVYTLLEVSATCLQREGMSRNIIPPTCRHQTLLALWVFLPPPRRLRTALLVAQHPEHIVQVVADDARRIVRNHLRRAQRVKVMPFTVSTHQRDALQIQGTRRPLAARQVGRLLHQVASTARHPTGIPSPHPVHVVLPPATTTVKAVAILIRQLHVAPAVVPTDANQPASRVPCGLQGKTISPNAQQSCQGT